MPKDRRRPLPIAAGLAALLVALAAEDARAAPPEVAVESPAALRPGSAAVLTLRGSGLAGTRSLWTSWSGWLHRHDEEGWVCLDNSLKVPVHVPHSIPAGVEGVRVVATNGVSNLAWIIVDGLPTFPGPASDSPLLEPPVAVEGVMKEAGVRRYRFRMNEGQRLSIEVLAQRIGSPTDPVLRILDPAGNELVYANDTPGLGADLACEFRAPSTAEYQAEIRDAEYTGGAKSRFRLRIGAFVPGALSTVPVLGLPPGLAQEPSSLAWSSPVSDAIGSAQTEIGTTAPASKSAPWTAFARLTALGPNWDHTLLPVVEVVPRWVLREREPNDAPENATPVEPSEVRVGRFDSPNDRDGYRLTVTTAGWWRIDARSRTLGRAADPQLRLLNRDGKVIARASSGDPDPVLHHRFDAPGDYLLSVTESAGRHGPGREYAVVTESEAAAYQVSTESDALHVPVGGEQTLKLKLESRGYTGPIRIEAAGLPEGFKLKNPDVEPKKKDWDLVIECGSQVAAGTAFPVRFTASGTAGESGGGSISLDLGPAQRKAFPRMLWVPPGMLYAVWIAAVPP
ncbi:MAG: hypothetical protein AB7O66_17790 [Limisphaerales bacterium]